MEDLWNRKQVCAAIDHTLLRADSKPREIARLCEEANRYGFHAVCVHPVHIAEARRRLAGSGVRVASVVDFPFGSSTSRSRVYQAMDAAMEGADELDIVMPISQALAGAWNKVEDDLAALIMAAPGCLHKIILETGYLDDSSIKRAAIAAVNAGAAFVKTSTGLGPSGARVKDVKLLHRVLKGRASIKASGGIRSASQCLGLLRAGAGRIGTSSAVRIIKDL